MPEDWELYHELEASNTFQKMCYIAVPAPAVRPWQRLPRARWGEVCCRGRNFSKLAF